MVINFSCPSCGKAYQLPQSVAGKTVPCNKCRTAMEIPSSTSKSAANVSLPAGNTNVPVTQVHANKKKYVIWTLLALGGLMLLGIGFVGGRSTSVEVVDRTEADSLTDPDSPDSNNSDDTQESDSQTPPVVDTPPETDPAADKAAKIAAALDRGDWKAVLALDSNNSKAKEMKVAADKAAKIAAALKKGDWEAVLALDPNNSKAKEMKVAAANKAQIAAALDRGDWKAVLALDPNNGEGKRLKVAAANKAKIDAALKKGDWKAVLALDPNNGEGKRLKAAADKAAKIDAALATKDWEAVLKLDPNNKEALEMQVAAETVATVIAPKLQEKDGHQVFTREDIEKQPELEKLVGLYYFDFSVEKNKPPSPKIIPYQPGERRGEDDRWPVKIHPVIENALWKMTLEKSGDGNAIAYLRYIAEDGILRFYRGPAQPTGLRPEEKKLFNEKIGGVRFKDLLAYSQLIQIHEGIYISAGISTASLFGKLPGKQLANKARHTGMPAPKPPDPTFPFHEINITDLTACADQGFITRPATWNFRLVAICYRHEGSAKWKQLTKDLFNVVKTKKNPESFYDSHGLKLKHGDLTYMVKMLDALDATTLQFTAQGNAIGAIRKLRTLKGGLDAATKSKLDGEKAQQINAVAMRNAQAQLGRAQNMPDGKPVEKQKKQIALGNARRLISVIANKNESLPQQIKDDIVKIKKFEEQIANHLAAHPKLAAIKDNIKELGRYGNLPNLGNHYLKLCLEISQARELPNGGWINVPIWHASPVQPILDEAPGFQF